MSLPAECGPGGPLGLISFAELSGEDKRYTQGEIITVTLSVVNCGDNDAHLFFATTQRYDFSVEDASGTTVWSSSQGRAFEQVTGEEVIKLGDRLQYTDSWDQKDANGQRVSPGTYRLKAYSVGCGEEGASDCRFGPVEQLEIQE